MSTRKAVSAPRKTTVPSLRRPAGSSTSPSTADAAALNIQFGYLITRAGTVTLDDFQGNSSLGNGTIPLPRGPGPVPTRGDFDIEVDGLGRVRVSVAIEKLPD